MPRTKRTGENEMIPYQEQTTEELIALLFKEEDRVTLEHIQELAARADAIEPLREILRNEFYWEEGQYSEFWIEIHAVSILSLARAEAAIPDLLNAIELSALNDMDWLNEQFAGHLAQFGVVIVEPLKEWIRAMRDKYLLNFEYSFARTEAAEALIRIALEHPEVKTDVVDFLCDLLLDPTENDPTFNGLLGDQLVYIDREQTIVAVRAAFARGSVDETIAGNFEQFLEGIDEFQDMRMGELTADPLDFYQPDKIAARQKRWKQEETDEARRLVAGIGPAALTSRRAAGEYGGFDDDWGNDWEEDEPMTVAPEGYTTTASGTVQRTEQTGRNDPCPCGSGKKYKKCCGK